MVIKKVIRRVKAAGSAEGAAVKDPVEVPAVKVDQQTQMPAAKEVQKVETPEVEVVKKVETPEARGVKKVEPPAEVKGVKHVETPQVEAVKKVDTEAKGVKKVETPEVKEVQKVETPEAQGIKQVETPEVKEVQKVETPEAQVETPEVKEVQKVETPEAQGVKQVETPEVKEVQKAETPEAQGVKQVETPEVKEVQKAETPEAEAVKKVEKPAEAEGVEKVVEESRPIGTPVEVKKSEDSWEWKSGHDTSTWWRSPSDHYDGGYSQWREYDEASWDRWDWPPRDWRPEAFQEASWNKDSAYYHYNTYDWQKGSTTTPPTSTPSSKYSRSFSEDLEDVTNQLMRCNTGDVSYFSQRLDAVATPTPPKDKESVEKHTAQEAPAAPKEQVYGGGTVAPVTGSGGTPGTEPAAAPKGPSDVLLKDALQELEKAIVAEVAVELTEEEKAARAEQKRRAHARYMRYYRNIRSGGLKSLALHLLVYAEIRRPHPRFGKWRPKRTGAVWLLLGFYRLALPFVPVVR